jgi:hypothetical protein
MNQSDVARLALKIYQQHRRAIDVIASHTPSAVMAMINARVMDLMNEHSDRLSILVEPFTKEQIIRSLRVLGTFLEIRIASPFKAIRGTFSSS